MASAVHKNTASASDIKREVQIFISGSTLATKVPTVDLARSALFLLQNLPSSRYAVLEYLGTIFDEAAGNYVRQVTGQDKQEAGEVDAIIGDVQEVLMHFIRLNPSAWAPIISAWSIQLLGQISNKHSDRRTVPHTSSLNDQLQLWMTCPATKVLIEIVSECFALMVENTPDSCVDALLEASVKYSPYFDWVVAHIGSCFPKTVITRVLNCGLKDYWSHSGNQSSTVSEEKVPKMASVVGILGHLASRHSQDIRQALIKMFQDSLRVDSSTMQLAAGPFLLHLASMSPMLLQIITADFSTVVTPASLTSLVVRRKPKNVIEMYSGLTDLIVHLLILLPNGAYSVLKFIMETADGISPDENAMETDQNLNDVVIQESCAVIMNKFVQEIQKLVLQKPHHTNKADIAIIKSLTVDIPVLTEALANAKGKRSGWLCSLLACMGAHLGEVHAAEIISSFLGHSMNAVQIGAYVRIQQDLVSKNLDVLPRAVQTVVHLVGSSSFGIEEQKQKLTYLENLQTLVQWETSQKKIWAGSSLKRALQDHIEVLASLLLQPGDMANACIELLILLDWSRKFDSAVVSKVCLCISTFFFNSLQIEDGFQKFKNCKNCRQLLQDNCNQPTAQKTILRLLIEGAFNEELAPLFGAHIEKVTSAAPTCNQTNRQFKHLLSENLQLSQAVNINVFHAGIIGQGVKPTQKVLSASKEEQIINKSLLLELLWGCSHYNPASNLSSSVSSSDLNLLQDGSASPSQTTTKGKGKVMSLSIARFLALLLIEHVAPDVMYNGIPWLEQEFMKITVERDIIIRKKFDHNPVLWDIMDLVASGPGAMCYCSSLLRSMMATLMSSFEKHRDQRASTSPRQLTTLTRLFGCMRQGGLLPEPLCSVEFMFPHLMSWEVYLLLQNTWDYMKENPPVPEPKDNVKKDVDPKFTRVLYSTIHRNITQLGHLCPKFFPDQHAS